MNPPTIKHNVKASVEFITPAMAKELLGSNTSNQRTISKKNLSKIESDLRNDRYMLTGEPIIIGLSGKLLDGQHRLCACVNTKTGFWTVVVRGVDDEYFNVINVGKGRTLADILKIAGEVNCNNLACTISVVARYVRDASSVGLSNAVSTSEAMDTLAMMPQIRQSVADNCHISSDSVVSCGRIAWLHCLASEECPDEAKEFFDKLYSGEMLSAKSPIYLLRSRLIADKQSKAKLPQREVFALLIKGWNAFISGESIAALRWIQSEKFPILKFKK